MAGTCGYGEGLSGSINTGNFLTSLLVSFSRTTLLHGVSKQALTILRSLSYDHFPLHPSFHFVKPSLLSALVL